MKIVNEISKSSKFRLVGHLSLHEELNTLLMF